MELIGRTLTTKGLSYMNVSFVFLNNVTYILLSEHLQIKCTLWII